MRVWSIHPKYLDAKGLVAAWREGLLAQKCLAGLTKGYHHHPQLDRFKQAQHSMAAIGLYLKYLADEAVARSYNFNASKITQTSPVLTLTVTKGQLEYEWGHFMKKITTRDPERHASLLSVDFPEAHPLFSVIEGGIESWEIV